MCHLFLILIHLDNYQVQPMPLQISNTNAQAQSESTSMDATANLGQIPVLSSESSCDSSSHSESELSGSSESCCTTETSKFSERSSDFDLSDLSDAKSTICCAPSLNDCLETNAGCVTYETRRQSSWITQVAPSGKSLSSLLRAIEQQTIDKTMTKSTVK